MLAQTLTAVPGGIVEQLNGLLLTVLSLLVAAIAAAIKQWLEARAAAKITRSTVIGVEKATQGMLEEITRLLALGKGPQDIALSLAKKTKGAIQAMAESDGVEGALHKIVEQETGHGKPASEDKPK